MPEQVRPIAPEDGWPKFFTASADGWNELAISPGANRSHFITGFLLTGAGLTTDGFVLKRLSCFKFIGTGDYLTISDAANAEPATGDFTFVIHVKIASAITAIVKLLSKFDVADSDGYKLVLTGGKPVFTMQDSDGDAAAITGCSQINDNLWHQIVITCDRDVTTGLKMYVDGKSVATAVDCSGANNNVTGSDEHLVTYGVASHGFSVSSIGFSKGTALSATQVAALWANGAGTKFTASTLHAMTLAYNVDENTGTAVKNIYNPGTDDGTLTVGGTGDWVDGDGAPFDPHTLKDCAQITVGTEVGATAAGAYIVPNTSVVFPHAIRIGRNNPIRIYEDYTGAWKLWLFGYTDGYR